MRKKEYSRLYMRRLRGWRLEKTCIVCGSLFKPKLYASGQNTCCEEHRRLRRANLQSLSEQKKLKPFVSCSRCGKICKNKGTKYKYCEECAPIIARQKRKSLLAKHRNKINERNRTRRALNPQHFREQERQRRGGLNREIYNHNMRAKRLADPETYKNRPKRRRDLLVGIAREFLKEIGTIRADGSRTRVRGIRNPKLEKIGRQLLKQTGVQL